MANYIYCPWRTVSPPKKHGKLVGHRAGWTHMWAQQLNATVVCDEDIPDDCTHLYIENGMEFDVTKPSFNQVMSGEMWDKVYRWMNRWITYLENGGECTLLDHPTDGWNSKCWTERMWSRYDGYQNLQRRFAAGEKGVQDPGPSFGTFFPHRVQVLAKVSRQPILCQKDLPQKDFNGVTLGDSHSLSTWVPGTKASRNDGQTLHGALKRGFRSYLEELNMKPGMDHLRLYFGNIDIRHHLCRLYGTEAEQEQATRDMVRAYVAEAKKAKSEWNIETVEIVDTLPIEMTARRIPGTGRYPWGTSGKNFWGTWEQRMRVHQAFNDELRVQQQLDPFFEIVAWPEWFAHDEDYVVMSNRQSAIESPIKKQNPPVELVHPKGALRFEVMEVGGSVHLIPEFYTWADKFSVWTERNRYYGQGA